jgi:RHS repeat-associated protein
MTVTPAGGTASEVSYGWDNANRLKGIFQGNGGCNSSGNPAVGFQCDAASRRQSLTLPNGIVVGYSYDLDSHVSGMTWTLNGSQIGDLEYSYDADGRVSQKTGSMEQPGLPWTGSMGNTYNADNELTGFNGTVPTYDADGNLTSDGTYTYTWDARNHLSGAAGASFVYDALGRRVQNGTQGDEFLYDGLNPVQTLVSGTPNANILTGLGIDERFTRMDSAGTASFLVDILGSTLALADPSGAINTRYTYEPFGNTMIDGASTNPFQFTGRENDWPNLYPELYYYRARYYSPMFQRFVSQDPRVTIWTLNRYGYALNDPLNLNDPLGLFPWPWGVPVNALLGGGNCGLVGGAAVGAAGSLLLGPAGAAGGALIGNFAGQAICNDPCAGALNCNEEQMLPPPPKPPCSGQPASS